MFDDWWWLGFLPLAVLFWLVAGRPGWRRDKRAPATEQMSTRADETVTLAAAQTTLPLETLPPRAAAEAEAPSPEDGLAADEAALRAAYRAMEEDQERRAAERRAAEETARLEAERQAAEQAAREEARRATEEAARRAAETARAEAERRAAEQAARAEAERRAADEAARLEADRLAAEAAARAEADRRAAEAAARLEAERRAAEEAARAEAQRRAAEEAARLEAERRAAEEAARAEAERQRAAAAAMRLPEDTLVMVADDSKVVRVKTSRLLAAQRYRVALAEDGQEALRQIAAAVPNVLITDVEMPGMDGFELTRHVRENAATRHVPIIMITSADDRLQQAAAEAGVTVLLGKPYPEEVLLAHIARLARVEAATPAAAG